MSAQFLGVGGLALCCALGGVLPAAAADGAMYCETRCSDVRLRTGVAILSWTGVEAMPSSRTAGGARTAPELETTVFKHGFDLGRYVRLGVPVPGARAMAAGQGEDPRRLRAYDLNVVQVRSGDARLLPHHAAVEDDLAVTSVEVEGLEAGVLYTFRLRVRGRAPLSVSCEAPICPADMREETNR